MNIPKTQYKKAKYSQGDTFIEAKSKKPFVGWYFERYDGLIMSGKKPTKASIQLITTSEGTEKTLDFTSETITVPDGAREKGFFTRYYVQDKRNKQIIEVKIDKYNKLVAKTYLVGVSVKWKIKGPVDNLITKGYKFVGAKETNKQSVSVYKAQMKELVDYIDNYSEFVE